MITYNYSFNLISNRFVDLIIASKSLTNYFKHNLLITCHNISIVIIFTVTFRSKDYLEEMAIKP